MTDFCVSGIEPLVLLPYTPSPPAPDASVYSYLRIRQSVLLCDHHLAPPLICRKLTPFSVEICSQLRINTKSFQYARKRQWVQSDLMRRVSSGVRERRPAQSFRSGRRIAALQEVSPMFTMGQVIQGVQFPRGELLRLQSSGFLHRVVLYVVTFLGVATPSFFCSLFIMSVNTTNFYNCTLIQVVFFVY
jgi:hypothetical protein